MTSAAVKPAKRLPPRRPPPMPPMPPPPAPHFTHKLRQQLPSRVVRVKGGAPLPTVGRSG